MAGKIDTDRRYDCDAMRVLAIVLSYYTGESFEGLENWAYRIARLLAAAPDAEFEILAQLEFAPNQSWVEQQELRYAKELQALDEPAG